MVKAENVRFRNYLQWPIFYHQLRMIKPNYLFILPFPSAQMQNHSFCRNSPPLFSFFHFSFIAFQLIDLFLLLQFILANV